MKMRSAVLFSILLLLTVSGRAGVTLTRTLASGSSRMQFASLGQAYAWLKKQPGPLAGSCLIQLHSSETPDSTLFWAISGTPSAPITIRGDSGVVLSGARVRGRAYGRPVLILSWVSYVTLENLIFYDFDGRKESRMALSITGKGHNAVRSCTFRRFYGSLTEAAISLYNDASYNLIEKCVFDSLGDDIYIHAIYLNKNCCHNRILNNRVRYCSGEAFMVRDASNDNLFDGNVIDRCSGVAYYGEWYNKETAPPERPSHGNLIRNSRNGGPGRAVGYEGHRFIRKVRAMDWSMYKWPQAGQELGDSTQAYYLPKNAANTFVTVPQEMTVEVDSICGDDPAHFRLGNEGLYHGQTDPSGSIDGTPIELVFADTTNRWGGLERYLREVRIADVSDKPRRYRTPLRLLTLEGDVVAQMTPQRWLGDAEQKPLVQRLTGAGQTLTFRVDSLSANYDLFLLPASIVWNETALAMHFKESDGGWQFFYSQAAKTGSAKGALRARSCNSGVAAETLKWFLKENQVYYLVVCAKERKTGYYRWSARP